MIGKTASRLSELAAIISSNTVILERYYQENDLPMPSFEVGTLVDAICQEPVVERARIITIEASIELRDLLEGPIKILQPVLNGTSLHAVYKFDIPNKVPLDSDISYEDLAKQCDLDAGILRRIIRFAIAHHRVFQEKREDYVSHSAASRLLVDSSDAMAALGMELDDTYRGFARTVDSLQKFDHQTPTQCGWALANQTEMPIWEFNAKDPGRSNRTRRAMRQFSKTFGYDLNSLVHGWDWASLDQQQGGASVLDLGGANGHASIALARTYKNLRFEVQDLPSVIEAATAEVPIDLEGRVTMKAHDFKQPQPTQADVYLLRQVLHDWPDFECVKILQALVPSLKSGARIVVNDHLVLPPGAVSPLYERHIRAIDMIVMTLCGAKERGRKDWEKVFSDADTRFTNIKTYQPDGCCLGIIEATWSG